ncbi:L-proline dehydrogenase /delta-1-pyrroline-5-carboxylate dehydrogenase [Oceanospirillum multiglobuliferum]|nr:bifunctional proline dehydrogenase/L-glutamate gamma-semialdehyde dehydrogenase PutA [Oceanospirillum multiglobuliferum]SKA04159.1 L-proline dehydrogenase /delta-1-pyrroline-5-carboxylate dehydrogenase [Oceanospirillum multiglobuliferum]
MTQLMNTTTHTDPNSTAAIREVIRDHYLTDEARALKNLMAQANLSVETRQAISKDAAYLIRQVRESASPSMMENFLAEYGLTTKEGVALMCLAEALLRVPDAQTIDELIEDKIAPGKWSEHLGQSESSLINMSTWALMLTGKLISPAEEKGLGSTLRGMVKRLGEPLVRTAVKQAMKELGRQFVLGRTIQEATQRAKKEESRGYSYSYDMLGEAARTDADALRYHKAYGDAITALKPACVHDDIRKNPGISVKLSALHPRYEFAKRERVLKELVERTLSLAIMAKDANMGFNIDAEEADRLDLSLDVIEAVLERPELKGWQGFGIVVQAFGPRAPFVLDWLYALAGRLERRIMVRLVKGAYWDAEIKRAQVMGLSGFPVYTRKVNTDVSYISCATKLLKMTDRIYPQFATHNAHSVAAILNLATDLDSFEFQRLHGMGESLHDAVVQGSDLTKNRLAKGQKVRCRIYAPVGAHQDLLAYLVRRLLENGANSSFVNQIVDTSISPEQIARDPFSAVEALNSIANPVITRPADIYGTKRRNSIGWDITDSRVVETLEAQRTPFLTHQWQAQPMVAGDVVGAARKPVINPANPSDQVGEVLEASPQDIDTAIQAAKAEQKAWAALPVAERSARIQKVADLFEENAAELFALATREAGKTVLDGIAEIREAVDFALYYPNEAELHDAAGQARGVITCISPWNFPLAIFAGQVLAAVAAGNAVLAKPAEQTVLMAARAVELMHEAGIPKAIVQLLPGTGAVVGAALTSDARIDGVCFTGSTLTAQHINRAMAANMAPDAPLIAETGGLNAMIVDSTALPEQVVRDVLASAFQSAGQRCSALRVLYLQKDIAGHVLEMLYGAMKELTIGNPWLFSTDIGPVIDTAAQQKIMAHIKKFTDMGRCLKTFEVPQAGTFVPPTVLSLNSIDELAEEIFGPVLHVCTFEADELDAVVDLINSKGFGLTFGLHTRVDARVEQVTSRIHAGNLYVNRNQIGAIVGSQPFGGEGLSGTGPKAGGPLYLRRFKLIGQAVQVNAGSESALTAAAVNKALADLASMAQPEQPARLVATHLTAPAATDLLNTREMPGPTGELNRLSFHARGVVLCLGPDQNSAMTQAAMALSQGNRVLVIAQNVSQTTQQLAKAGLPIIGIDGQLAAECLAQIQGIDAVASNADLATLKAYRQVLAQRDGVLLPLLTEPHLPERFIHERHLCVDTTAAGGNASLIAATN